MLKGDITFYYLVFNLTNLIKIINFQSILNSVFWYKLKQKYILFFLFFKCNFQITNLREVLINKFKNEGCFNQRKTNYED